MHDLMLGMFWGGLLMALPPIAVGIAITVALLRYQRQNAVAERRERGE